MNIELLGIKVKADRKDQVITELSNRIDSGEKTFIVTPYSEFFYRGFFDFGFKQILNKANISLPDSIAVLWLAYFLQIPFKAKSFYGKVFESLWQAIYSLVQILLHPSRIRSVIPEKISGSDFFWDLLKIADQKKLSVFLLGGFEDTAEIVSKEITEKYPNIQISGTSNSTPSDPELVDKINTLKPDILMVAFGPVKQETWIANNLERLNVKVAIGLGGTFDYVSGKKASPPNWVRKIGLEWLFRLVTQPKRFKRIWNATFGLVRGAIRYKVFMSMPFRPNVAGVILNQQNQVFVALRTINDHATSIENQNKEEHWQFPQGGIDPGENVENAVLREMREELGMTELSVLGVSDKYNEYYWNNTLRPLWFNKLKFKGQKQIVYYLRYEGDGSDIVLDQKELRGYKWIEIGELESTIHFFRQSLVKIVLADIGKYI